MLRWIATVSLFVLISVGSSEGAFAGSPLNEIEYRNPCYVRGQSSPLSLQYNGRSNSAVELDYWSGRPVLNVNERVALEQPFIVVAFEYFVACSMAQNWNESDLRRAQGNPGFARDMLRRFDCDAIDDLFQTGTARSYSDFDQLLDYLLYRKAESEFLGVPFWARAESIDRSCPP